MNSQIRKRIERLEKMPIKLTRAPRSGAAPSLTFSASIAPLQSAITIASDGGARVKIDIPESEMDAVVRLMGMRERTLRITIEMVDDE